MICLNLTSRIAGPAFAAAAGSALRHYSSDKKPLISLIPHQFSTEEAWKRFLDAKNPLFSPTPRKSAEVSMDVNPIKKVFVPCFSVDANIESSQYQGQYGILRSEPYVGGDGKIHTRIRTDWYDTQGTLGPRSYSLLFYAGNGWDESTMMRAMREGRDGSFDDIAVPFDPKKMSKEILVDPFCKPSAIAQSEGYKEMKDFEVSRAERDIRDRHWRATLATVDKIDSKYGGFKISSYLLPAYVLEYPKCPPRVMPAFNQRVVVIGKSPLSAPKCMMAASLGTAALSLMFPQVSIPARVGMTAASAVMTGLWAQHRLSIAHHFQQTQKETRQRYYESVNPTMMDKKRSEMTSKNKEPSGIDLGVGPIHYEILGLDSKQQVTEEMVQKAFLKRFSDVNADKNKSGKESHNASCALITARSTLIGGIRRARSANLQNDGTGKRFYSSGNGPIKEPPRSIYHPQARRLIQTLLEEKDYEKALSIVHEEEVHPDSHDIGENTLLTQAAKLGDIKAIRFAVDELGACPDTSCDCPAHRTALHYAVKNKRPDVIKALLDKKANPNLLDSLGNTPLDIAISQGDEASQKVLSDYGALRHNSIPGKEGVARTFGGFLRAITGNGSSARTRLLSKESNVIHLPPSDKK